MAKKEEGYSKRKRILVGLDVFLAVFIILTATTLVNTQFGKASIAFGFIMLVLSTILTIIESN